MRRRTMMNQWADYIDTVSGRNVVQLQWKPAVEHSVRNSERHGEPLRTQTNEKYSSVALVLMAPLPPSNIGLAPAGRIADVLLMSLGEKSLFLFRRPSGKSAYFVCLGAR